jgi:tetratricopeptide (TPR) repeat protein
MDCREIENSELAEKYILGQLGADEQQSYEEHYFQCSNCFEELQLRQTMQSELGKMRPGAPVVQARRGKIDWLAWGAVAAALLVAAGLGWWRFHRTPAPVAPVASNVAKPMDNGPALDLLARAEPPAYTAPALRGGSTGSGARFREGMAHYRVGNYEAAIASLTSAASTDPKSADAQFFLGICYLLKGQTDLAIARLRATIDLGDSLDLEMAHFYLAKARLRERDAAGAEAELDRAIAMRGDLEKQSRELLGQIRKVTATR